ncbi:MAG: PKD domain-containing protein, partial [Candidatus Kariarchaeaceae archaeon]
LSLGSNEYTNSLSASDYGPTSGTIAVTGSLPTWDHPSDISYYIEDEDGGKSQDYELPLIDYSKLIKPAEFQNFSTWDYSGHIIDHYTPVSDWIAGFDYEIGNSYHFLLEAYHPDPKSLHYTWNFGTGETSAQQFATYAFDYKGSYLVWALVSDDYYDYVSFKTIDVTSPAPMYYPTVQGIYTEGSNLNFLVSGVANGGSTDQLVYHWDFGDGTTGFGTKFEHAYTYPGNYTVLLTVNDQYNIRDTTEFLTMIVNAPPFTETELQSSLEVSEGTNVVYLPNIIDSPYDTLNLYYDWIVNGVEYTDASLWLKTAQAENSGKLVAYDTNGGNFTYEFSFNVSSNPLEMTVPNYYHLYGNPAKMINIVGTICPSIFERNTYRIGTSVEYTLFDKNGLAMQTDTGSLIDDFHGFSALVNTSMIGTDEIFDDLESQITDPEDLTDENSPSGSYRVVIRLLDQNNAVITSTSTTLLITIDKDGDFITDDLEVLYSKTIDYLDFDIHETDTDDDGIADPVEYVLGNDKDGDGLPEFFEQIYGTSDENPDTDGDGLTDGYGPYGEVQLGTDGTKEDTDGDGLKDGEEIAGWDIQLITPKGLVIKEVTSSPLLNDTDGDGVNDFYEMNFKIDPRSVDTDSDGLDDKREQDVGTSLLSKDTDFDGISDYDEVTKAFSANYTDAEGIEFTEIYYLNPLTPDSDEDNVTDYDEVFVYGSVGTNKDTDNDGLNDYQEIHTYGTKTNDADTDGDGLADGIELSGFEIPIVLISKGVYSENGTVITQPTVNNYTISVITDPLNMDTDGDGLTDWEELLGDPDNVGDPTNVDSDGDGILDLWDPQRLISDYTPPNITSAIDVEYTIRPGKTAQTVVNTLRTGLSVIWNLIKNTAKLFWDILNSFFYWKKHCVWKFCIWLPSFYSWSTIISNIKAAFLNFAKRNINTIFPVASQYKQSLTNTLSFERFGLKIKKVGGVPKGIDLWGSLTMVVRNVVDTITSIVDPLVNIQFDVEDEAGIKKIVIHRDGAPLKTINNINRKHYQVNEFFALEKNGFSLGTTNLVFEIHDLNGNVRMIERTTTVKTFTGAILAAGITFIKETATAIIQKLKDVVSWLWDKLQQFGAAVVDTIKNIASFVNETFHKVVNWIKAQFHKIWEGFIRSATNLLMKGKEYLDRAGDLLNTVSNTYSEVRGEFVSGITLFRQSPFVQTINDSLNDAADLIDEYFPPFDKKALTDAINSFLGPIQDAINGTIIQFAIDILSGKALQILVEIVKKQVEKLFGSVLGSYLDTVIRVIEEILEQLTIEPPAGFPINPSPDEGTGGIVEMFVDALDMMRNPAAALGKMLSSITGEYIMSQVDKFLLDNPKYLVSLNDILFTMLKPALALGLVFYDLINFASSAISSVFPLSGFHKVLSFKHEMSQPSRNIRLDESEGVQIACTIVAFIGKLVDLAFAEGFRIYDVKDRQDKDIEKGMMAVKSGLGLLFLGLTDITELIKEFNVGRTAHEFFNFSQWEDPDINLLRRKIVMTIIKASVLVFNLMAAGEIEDTQPQKDAQEKVFTAIFDWLGWIINLVDACVYTGFFIYHTVMGHLSAFELQSWLAELVNVWLITLYEPISTWTDHGTKLAKLAFPANLLAVVYYGFAVFTVLHIAVTTIMGFIIDMGWFGPPEVRQIV